MRISTIGLYGRQLTRLGVINCFLVNEEDGYTLVDTNLKRSEQAILEAAADHPIRRILLTHPHVDHIGSVDALMEKLPGLELLTSKRSIPILQVPADLSLRAGEVAPFAEAPRELRANRREQ